MSSDENRAKPVVFLAFANEQEGWRYLRNLPEESRQLQSILQGAKDRNLCELEVRANVTLSEIDEVFRRITLGQQLPWAAGSVSARQSACCPCVCCRSISAP